jgi:hypothetical protein
MLNLGVQVVKMLVPLALSAPTLSHTRRLRATACSAMHCTALSETHLESSAALYPDLIAPVVEVEPNPAPCNERDSDPVPAAFVRLAPLSEATSDDSASVTLPPRAPTLS